MKKLYIKSGSTKYATNKLGKLEAVGKFTWGLYLSEFYLEKFDAYLIKTYNPLSGDFDSFYWVKADCTEEIV